MRFIITFCLALILDHSVKCQEVSLRQYSFYCESNIQVDEKYLQERIKSMHETSSNGWEIEAIIFDDCNIRLYPVVRMQGDTLVVHTYRVEKQELKLSNGDTIVEHSQPEDCECAYELRMELQADSIGGVRINNKNLRLSDEEFQTFPIKYLIYKSDTTGYVDKYGLRQGCYVIERGDGVLKTYFKDNKCTRCELWDLAGQILKQSNDCLGCTSDSQRK